MNQNKLSFESEKLTVDWIRFKFQSLNNFAQTKLAEYVFNLGFNFYQESGKSAKPVKESIFVSSKNKFQVLFVYEALYWICSQSVKILLNCCINYFFAQR